MADLVIATLQVALERELANAAPVGPLVEPHGLPPPLFKGNEILGDSLCVKDESFHAYVTSSQVCAHVAAKFFNSKAARLVQHACALSMLLRVCHPCHEH